MLCFSDKVVIFPNIILLQVICLGYLKSNNQLWFQEMQWQKRCCLIQFGHMPNLLNFVLQQERGIRRPDSSKRSANTKPTKTLFVINFDPVHTRERDLERHFDPHGKVLNIRIRRNFAFIQFASEEDSTRALEATNMRFVSLQAILMFYSLLYDFELWLI